MHENHGMSLKSMETGCRIILAHTDDRCGCCLPQEKTDYNMNDYSLQWRHCIVMDENVHDAKRQHIHENPEILK